MIRKFDSIVEQIIQESQRNGEFKNLPGSGEAIDLKEYFETPEEYRMVYKIMKDNDMVPDEVRMIKELADSKEMLLSDTLSAEERMHLQEHVNKLEPKVRLKLDSIKR